MKPQNHHKHILATQQWMYIHMWQLDNLDMRKNNDLIMLGMQVSDKKHDSDSKVKEQEK